MLITERYGKDADSNLAKYAEKLCYVGFVYPRPNITLSKEQNTENINIKY